jgi:4-diphosphocytidyl-2-C-methyl-D-erythritol kinase
MITFPNGKINLGLHVTSKRSDGYHEIESCMVPVPVYDVLEMVISAQHSFSISGLSIPGNTDENLIKKAFSLLKKDYPDIPAIKIHLYKNIPIGAGLGGGSADASFALTLMNKLFGLGIKSVKLEEYAATLGSDCPFFVENQPKLVRGRGEIMSSVELNLKGVWVYLVYPQIHIGTKEAYAGLTPKKPTHSLSDILHFPETWKEKLVNDFEPSLFDKYPELERIKNTCYENGAFYASMSGSGSSVFGLFEQQPGAIDFPDHYFVVCEPIA